MPMHGTLCTRLWIRTCSWMHFRRRDMHPFSLQTLATNRSLYLQQPHLGKSLASSSIDTLLPCQNEPCTIALVVADGLSATAIHEHALPMMQLLLPQLQKLKYSYSPICLVEQGRVAIGDPIGQLLKSSLSLVFIGERPGLSSPNSMGIYLTYQPRIGNTDEKRNCISKYPAQWVALCPSHPSTHLSNTKLPAIAIEWGGIKR